MRATIPRGKRRPHRSDAFLQSALVLHPPTGMRVLVYGAGVIGCLYAARMTEAGSKVTVLARGPRLEAIRARGIELQDVATGSQSFTRVATIDRLAADDPYDLVFVPVRGDQLDSVLPVLSASRMTPNVLFFGNDARGPSAQVAALGRARVMLGFPGAGGCIDRGVVRYIIISEQRTTVGELDGARTARITAAAKELRAGGFSVAISRDMSGWLTTHAAFVTCIAAALYIAAGDAPRLASEPETLRLMVRATRETLGALRAIGVGELPFNLRVLYRMMPVAFAVRYWQRALLTPLGAFGLAAHANAARPEMTLLAAQVVERLQASPRRAPALQQLLERAGLG